MRGFVLFGALGVAFAGLLGAARSHQPPARLPDSAARAPAAPERPYGFDLNDQKPFKHLPSTSCASASCHGGGRPGKTGSEHSTWAPEAVVPDGDPHDPHAKAYRVLFNPVSVRMGQILKLTPHTDRRCLVCHAVDTGKDSADRDQILGEGVGCGGCHGPAEKWNAEHYLPRWKTLSNETKWKEYGFVPTKNLVARTLNCAGCHVGDAERDMNHDFIAAGHPRLAFESARFHQQPDYRKHWSEKGSAKDFEVRLWVVGQVATLRAAVNLMHERAARSSKDDKTPWPDFSHYSCYACHQTVGDTAETRGSLSATTRPPGVPGWEVWATAGFDVAAGSCGLAFPGLSSPKLAEVEKLRELMASKRAPEAGEVVKRSKAALAELDRWLAELQAALDRGAGGVAKDAPEQIAGRLAKNALSEDGKLLADHDWDALAANYLGVAAMYSAAGGKNGPGAEWRNPLLTIEKNLRFPAMQGVRPNGPFKFGRPNLDPIRDNFDTLRTKTATPEGKR